MKAANVMVSIASIALMGMVVFAALASAATNAPSAAPGEVKAAEEPMKAQMAACPMCPMMAGKGKDMGKDMGKAPAMKQHCQMMMNAEMSKDDAACLLALKEELKLTPEQVQKLEQIVKQSRQEATALLTPEQQKTLAEVPEKPASMCAMHAGMHEKMMKKMPAAAPKKTEEKAKKEPEGAAAPKK